MQEHDSFEKLSKKIYFFLETFSRLRKHKDKIVSFQLDFFLFDGPHHARNATQRNATQRNATQRNATRRNATQRDATQRNLRA